jgi:hypothetical protein
MERFLRLKEQVDPEGFLHNSFFERVFQYGQSQFQGFHLSERLKE